MHGIPYICQINLIKFTKCAIFNANRLFRMVCPRMQYTFISSVTDKANDLHKIGSIQYKLNKLVYSIYCMMRNKQYSSILFQTSIFQIISNKELAGWYMWFIFFQGINMSEANYFEESLWKTHCLWNIVCRWIMNNKTGTSIKIKIKWFLIFVLEKKYINGWNYKANTTESIFFNSAA